MASEIADLLNIALKTGSTQKEVQKELNAALTNAYLLWTHKESDPNIEINVDFLLGKVSICQNGNNITPKGFDEVAEQTMRKTLISIINRQVGVTKQSHKEMMTKEHTPSHTLDWVKQYIFWAYNAGYLIILIIAVLAIGINDGAETFNNIMRNVNVIQGVFFGLLVATPILAMYLIIAHNLQHNTHKLMQMLFKVEIPLIALSLFLIYAIEELSPPIWMAGIMMLALPFLEVMKLRKKDADRKITITAYIIMVVVTTIIAYSGLILAFFIPSFVKELVVWMAEFIKSIIESSRIGDQATMNEKIFTELPLRSLTLLILLTALATPYIIIWRLAKSLTKTARQLTLTYHPKTIKGITIATVVLICVVFVSSNTSLYPHPHKKVVTELKKYAEGPTYETKEQIAKELIPQKEKIENAIEKAETDPQKYLFIKSNKIIEKMYDESGTTKSTFLQGIQTLFNIVALPISYHGPELNIVKIRDAYQDLFGEKFEIKKYKSTRQIKTQESKNVIRVSRKYVVKPMTNGAFAQVSVDEQFTNTQFSNQEVIYEFTLPPEAVINDLKLGKNLEFQGQIAPRGAALRTYQQELRQMQDPALLEQVGPSQFRLRVFPIPPKTFDQTDNMPQQRVMFSYIVAITPKGYPLPKWTKEHNVQGHSQAQATLNNKQYTITNDQTTIPAPKTREEICEQKQPVILKTEVNTAHAQPTSALCDDPQKPAGKRIALYYDTSAKRGNSTQWQDVQNTVTKELMANNTLDMYFFNNHTSDKKNISDTPTYFGDRGDLSKINIEKGEYDELIIVTDKNANLTENTIINLSNVPKIYVVYETNAIPSFTQTVARALIQHNITVSDSFQDVMTTIAYANKAEYQKLTTPYWIIEEIQQKNISPNELEAVLARININNKMSNTEGAIEKDPKIIQPLHEQAINAKIVTLFSSYIALVNERQQQTLQKESQKKYAYIDFEPLPQQTPIILRLTENITFSGFGSGLQEINFFGYRMHNVLIVFIAVNAVIISGAIILFAVKYIKQKMRI